MSRGLGLAAFARVLPLLAGWAAFWPGTAALAWEQHRALMPWAVSELAPTVSSRLDARFAAPQASEDRETYSRLARELGLNPSVELPPLSTAKGGTVSGREILLGMATDEPDLGMDRDLPDTADPRSFRATMGGKTGPTSQGFRHMYFGGWKLSRPIATFQVPFHAIGLAPERAELMATKARELLRAGHSAWGFRILGWALHYVQDLAQPFHAVQIPSLRMVAWRALLDGFGGLVRETTRTIANYHWAYEGYALRRVSRGERCPGVQSEFLIDPGWENPRELAMAVADASVELGPETGSAAYYAFGARLKDPSIDLANGKGAYADPAEPAEINEVTCRALANAIRASRLLIEWALQP